MFVKICGLSTAETVAAAVDAGADAVGFVLTRSVRQVTPDRARELAAAVPPHVLTVAVVAGADIATVRDLVRDCGLRALQLHGDYSRDDFAAVADLGLTLVRATSHEAPDLRIGAYGEDLLLVDATEPGSGGAWDYAALRERSPGDGWILAGGLYVDTVADAIHRSGAGGVDVSSGVESARGVKSEALIRDFIAAARKAG
ncbi:N-(5'-phosphoribosyl)anthranilate isomerase [Catellatospora methionotrophica]|uniref:N-(5'-phosphoribosyl)anthranilate isomerase n=1 Tax=Catellatospora methionotrophica TaxID=121620 RepID=A0A8J3LD08_9ACTN|nr:phosphoribosylanthranilate isomerase [Catellatospora methionotrophica]GIG12355.1 N-(5'-phosphoribosyl)anthranilate isomerase [Catellatospora methionotrophica]